MVNSIVNDRGQTVYAIGAPGSLARVKVQYPKLIDRLNSLWMQQANIADAIIAVREAGISSPYETNSLIDASFFGQDFFARSIVKRIDPDELRYFVYEVLDGEHVLRAVQDTSEQATRYLNGSPDRYITMTPRTEEDERHANV